MRRLFVRVATGELLCGACWRAAGCPAFHPPATLAEVGEAEARIRAAMARRGGDQRHAVNSGRT